MPLFTSALKTLKAHEVARGSALLPGETAGEVLAHLYAVRDAPTLDAARAAADRFVNTYRRE